MPPAALLDDMNGSETIQISQRSYTGKDSNHRILLLAPPSLASRPEALDGVYEIHDRKQTDLQMIDRLALGLVSLPPDMYDLVLVLSDLADNRTERQNLIDRSVMAKIAETLKVGGALKSRSGSSVPADNALKTEAILAGLIPNGDGFSKPESYGGGAVKLTFGRKKKERMGGDSTVMSASDSFNGTEKRALPPQPQGVGFVDFGDDLDLPVITGEDDELVDEDELLTEEDKTRPVIVPIECRPKAGRRRACKTCTCGLKEQIEAEDAAKRSASDKALNTMKLEADDLAEVDFTVQGKVGSCGNCALGDAFRCDGCPYIGLPKFEPGEEIRLLNNDIQL